MLLAIDIGNSNIVVGVVENGKILHKARFATDRIKTSDQYWVELKDALSLFDISPKSVEAAIISSVVPPVLNSVRSAVVKMTGIEPMVVGPGMKTGLNILADHPAQVGSDLISAAVAAVRDYPKPIIVIDMGTATTISVLDRNGAFLGGSICPGIKISSEALTGRTAQLPAISLEAPKHAIGRNTIDCMKSGLMLGAAAMLDGMIDRMEGELGEKVTVVATGGISRFVIPACRREIVLDMDLLLKGLVILYENNRKDIHGEQNGTV
ncbi:MAG: type III pantothenate kinase [Oscillospiraceae bacterium]|nr:type III pantothenate kinase [Oscillospiraceae bacterium]